MAGNVNKVRAAQGAAKGMEGGEVLLGLTGCVCGKAG